MQNSSFEIKKENYQEKPSFFDNLAQLQMDRAQQSFEKQKAATDATTDVASALYNMTPAQKSYLGLNILPLLVIQIQQDKWLYFQIKLSR